MNKSKLTVAGIQGHLFQFWFYEYLLSLNIII